ncbi:phosphatase PAP2 family protein [Lacihabitans sp. LS3-19]|uniref:vanadium-dependent haloperoxidase n=1 Tax=Lacihabitans sp. LS3-19 TaxID=2487335 RepID=UPI0020CD2391|nr:vanadium-dependent haloperoxidase [Lacihabitans sp. LS3-19]MCP9767281.1 phosphatase PAP2 family protein [Lacihabitans sp. LS3-19]
MKAKFILSLIIAITFFISCKKNTDTIIPVIDNPSVLTSTFEGTMASDWLKIQLELIKSTPGFTPPVAARALGYTSLALYESVVHGMPGYQSLKGQLNGLSKLPIPDSTMEYNWGLVASVTQYSLLQQLYLSTSDKNKSKLDSVRVIYETKLKTGTTDEVIERSVRFGAELATAVFEYAKTDGGATGHLNNFPQNFVTPSGIGFWKPSGSQSIPLLPTWGQNRTLVKENMNDKLNTPVSFSFEKNSSFFVEAKKIYDQSKNLSTDQKAIANYFADGTGSITPPGHHFNVVRKILLENKTSLDEVAIAYAKTGLSLNDAFISCWKGKYYYFLMRPSTYIKQTMDKNWEPFLANPPFPEYASGHGTAAGATVTILESIFGNAYAFEDNTHEGVYPNRKYDSFAAYGSETSNSRIYGGIHYEFSCTSGFDNGKTVAQNILKLKFEK